MRLLESLLGDSSRRVRASAMGVAVYCARARRVID